MKISLALEKGYLPDKYGKFATDADQYKGQPIVSFPIEISEVPAGAKFLSLSLVDYDAIPVCGFPWIHWTAANIPVTGLIPENFSQTAPAGVVQGKNSQASPFVGQTDPKIAKRYTGPTPPDRDHSYTLIVTASVKKLELADGFWWNELRDAAELNLLGFAVTLFKSKA